MKYYGRVTSERASKGQGGRFLDIQVQDESREVIARMEVSDGANGPTARCTFSEGVEVEASTTGGSVIECPLDSEKGEKQEGETCGCAYCNGGDHSTCHW